jgi:hypothetical protein
MAINPLFVLPDRLGDAKVCPHRRNGFPCGNLPRKTPKVDEIAVVVGGPISPLPRMPSRHRELERITRVA